MSEKSEHRQICRYLRIQHPDVIFNTDLSGIKLNQGQAIAVKELRSSNGFPDITILEARKGFNGLFIELKRTGEVIYKKDGTPKTDHLKQQELMISNLKKRGYEACFCIGFEEAKNKIDWYFS